MAGERGVILQVGHVERFNPAVVAMEGMLEKPIFLESQRLHPFTTRGTDVDVVLDLMIHDLDIIFHIVSSQVKEIHSVGMPVITGKTDLANVRVIFENGSVANLTASRVSNNTVRKLRIFQKDIHFSVDYAKRRLNVTRLDGEVNDEKPFPQITSKMTYPESDPLADQIHSFVEAVRRKGRPKVSAAEGRKALMFAMKIIQQIEKGYRDFQKVC